jgi:hypothetical protein
MNWRIATTLNLAIAAVTVLAALSIHRTEHRELLAKSAAAEIGRSGQHSARSAIQESAQNDTREMRVDDLASVPPSELYQVLMRSSPEEIAALGLKFNDLPKNGKSIGATGIFFQAWAELDGKSALVGAFQIKDNGLKKMAIDTVVHSASPGVASELATYLKKHPAQDLQVEFRDEFFPQLLQGWSLIDAPAAAKFFDDLPLSKNSKSAYTAGTRIAYGWGTVDPNAALSWVEQHHGDPGFESGGLMNAVVVGWCDTDANAAANYVREHLESPGANLTVYSIAATLLDQDPKKGIDWLGGLPSSEAKSEAQSKLAGFWADRDPVAASRWVEQLPTEEQTGAIDPLVSSWAASDWSGASKWIMNLKGESHDAAVQSAIRNARSDVPPTESLALALSLTDADTRTVTLQYVINRWAQKDPEAAEAWIKSSALSKEEKDGLLSKGEPTP